MKIPKELIEWIESETEKVEYGQIGFILTLHQNQIVKIKKISEKDEKCLTKRE